MYRVLLVALLAGLLSFSAGILIASSTLLLNENDANYMVVHLSTGFELSYYIGCMNCEAYIMDESNIDLLKRGLSFKYNEAHSRPSISTTVNVEPFKVANENYFVLRKSKWELQQTSTRAYYNFNIYEIRKSSTDFSQVTYITIGGVVILSLVVASLVVTIAVQALRAKRNQKNYVQFEKDSSYQNNT
jgi:hypothetical protein